MLSGLDYANIVMLIGVTAAYVYVTYSALAIRNTLALGVYRGQALGIGSLALAFAAIDILNFFPVGGVLGFIQGIFFYSVSLLLLYWVDSSISAARRSDPLGRDTLGWSKVRIVVWSVSLVTIFFTIGSFAYFSQAGVTQPSDLLNAVFAVLFQLPIFLAASCG